MSTKNKEYPSNEAGGYEDDNLRGGPPTFQEGDLYTMYVRPTCEKTKATKIIRKVSHSLPGPSKVCPSEEGQGTPR